MIIFLDPGHGGTDPGACANGMIEKNMNLTVALKVRDILESNNIQVRMSRNADKTLELANRSLLSNSYNSDYFISIHHNAGGADGYEVIHSVSGSGRALAESIATEFSKSQNRRSVYSKQGNNGDYYAVIRSTRAISIITEYAFIDSKDKDVVDTAEELMIEATHIANGILNYLGIKEEVKPMLITDINVALDLLVSKGIINSKDYWIKTVDTVKYQKEFILNIANFVNKS